MSLCNYDCLPSILTDLNLSHQQFVSGWKRRKNIFSSHEIFHQYPALFSISTERVLSVVPQRSNTHHTTHWEGTSFIPRILVSITPSSSNRVVTISQQFPCRAPQCYQTEKEVFECVSKLIWQHFSNHATIALWTNGRRSGYSSPNATWTSCFIEYSENFCRGRYVSLSIITLTQSIKWECLMKNYN